MDNEALVSLADVAEMAGMTRPAASNWRRRNPDFPKPVEETGATSLFRFDDIRAWAAKHHKRLQDPSVDQLVWSAVNPERAAVLPEEAAQEGMTILGYLALARRFAPELQAELRAAMASGDERRLTALLVALDKQAIPAVTGEALAAPGTVGRSPGSRAFLLKLLHLAAAYSVSEVFDALVSAVGRGAKGEGEHTTPVTLTDLIMSLATPVNGVILDPACGYASMLTAASRIAGAGTRLIGQDVSPQACRVARLRMLAHNLPADITQDDPLRTAKTGGRGPEADLIVADPSFGTGHAMDWLRYGANRLRPGGRAMFVIENGAHFWTGADAYIREGLIEDGLIAAVIALPPALYPYTSVPVSLWILIKRPALDVSPRKGKVLLVDAAGIGRSRGKSRTELTPADIVTISACFRAWEAAGKVTVAGGLRAMAVTTEALLARGGNLNPESWIREQPSDPVQLLRQIDDAWHGFRVAHQALGKRPITLPALAVAPDVPSGAGPTMRKLADIAEIIRVRRIDPHWIDGGDSPFIRLQDIGPGLTVHPGGSVRSDGTPDRIDVTSPGDIVVATKGARLRAAVDRVGGAFVSAPLHIVRPLPDVIDPVILAALIRDAAGTAELATLEVPLPAPQIAERVGAALAELDRQRQQLIGAVAAIDRLSAGLGAVLSTPGVQLPAQASED